MDLDLSHYDYDDLRGLFQLPNPYTRSEWKAVYSVVKAVHPDKSRLDGSYFDFFKKAHALLGAVLQTRGHRKDIDDVLGRAEREKIGAMSHEQFSEWFNTAFEEVNGKEKGVGYGDWLASDEGLVETGEGGSVHTYFSNQRAKGAGRAALVVTDCGSSFDVIGEEPSSYSSSMFSKLQFDDVQAAHSQTFIPVDFSDFRKADMVETLEQRQQARSNASLAVRSTADSVSELSSIRKKQEASGMARQYRLTRQMEESTQRQSDVTGRLLALKSSMR